MVNLLMGSTRTTSGTYVGCALHARIFNKYVPNLRVTVVETGASVDNWKRMYSKDVDFSSVAGYETVISAHLGTSAFEGTPMPWGRQFDFFFDGLYGIVVRADSDIYTYQDLNGKKFATGNPGSGAETAGRIVLEALGIEYEPVYGSMGDASTQMKDGRVDAFIKFTPKASLDSLLADIRSVTPIRVLSMTEEEVTKTLQAYPGLVRTEIPAGTWIGAEEQDTIVSGIGNPGGLNMPSEERDPRFTTELVYQMAKAIDEHWDELLGGYPGTADPFQSVIDYTGDLAVAQPFHPGVVKYLQEKGVEVPASLIPPEYK